MVLHWTPLHWAANGARAEVAAFLIEQGAEVGARSGVRTLKPWDIVCCMLTFESKNSVSQILSIMTRRELDARCNKVSLTLTHVCRCWFFVTKDTCFSQHHTQFLGAWPGTLKGFCVAELDKIPRARGARSNILLWVFYISLMITNIF